MRGSGEGERDKRQKKLFLICFFYELKEKQKIKGYQIY
jgi:hypothetical protein